MNICHVISFDSLSRPGRVNGRTLEVAGTGKGIETTEDAS
jgi:hypothetical protein